jgi:hypothetical protein
VAFLLVEIYSSFVYNKHMDKQNGVNEMNAVAAEYTLEAIGRGEQTSIAIKVKGYWSRESITVYARPYMFDENGAWGFIICHSSGGRDKDEVEGDAQAARYFAEGMILAADIVDELKSKVDVLNKYREQMKAEVEAEYEAKQAAHAAKVAADSCIGSLLAESLIHSLKVGYVGVIRARKLGEDRFAVSFTRKAHGNAIIYANGVRVSVKAAVDLLATMSTRIEQE